MNDQSASRHFGQYSRQESVQGAACPSTLASCRVSAPPLHEERNQGKLLTVSVGDTGIGYGGVDTGGTLESSSRELEEFFSNWDDSKY